MATAPLSPLLCSSSGSFSFTSPPSYEPVSSPSCCARSHAAFFLDSGAGGESSRYPSCPDYSPSTPEYTPSTPDYSPSTPEYTPSTPYYSPSTPPCRAASPDYSPSTPPGRAASPDYTPSTPPPSPMVSDAESRTASRPRRHHPYQRSNSSLHQRAYGY